MKSFSFGSNQFHWSVLQRFQLAISDYIGSNNDLAPNKQQAISHIASQGHSELFGPYWSMMD